MERSFISLALAAGLLATGARASLGGDAGSVEADRAHLRGSLRTTALPAYTVHEIKAESGARVREYAAAGTVFAVTWQGPFRPDLRQVLGAYFDSAASALQERRRRGPVSIRKPGLVLEMGGHARWFTGRAWVPSMLPAGLAEKDIE